MSPDLLKKTRRKLQLQRPLAAATVGLCCCARPKQKKKKEEGA